MKSFYHTKTEIFIDDVKVYQCKNSLHSKFISFIGFFSRFDKNCIHKIKKINENFIVLHKNKIGYLKKNNLECYDYIHLNSFNDYSVLDFDVLFLNGETQIVYGEYKRNDGFNKVLIYSMNIEDGKVKKIFEFEAGLINHIHTVISHKDLIIVMTGDFGDNIGIYILHKNNSEKYSIKNKFIDGQEFRAAWGYIVEDELFFATDSQISQNYLKKLNIKSFEIENICILDTGSIYSMKIGSDIYFSTVVEPPKFEKRRIINYLSKDNAFNISKYHLYSFNVVNNCLIKIKSRNKNIIPAGVSGFGSFHFNGIRGTEPIISHNG